MKISTCCFTGHRFISENERESLQEHLLLEIEKLILHGVKFFGTGGALGFDTMAARAVLKLRNKYAHIRLILVLPCKEQAKSWSEKDKEVYMQIFSEADKIVYTSAHYSRGCMHIRNRHLVDYSKHCICYLNKKSGGTAYTVDYAQQKGLHIINLGLC